MKYLLVILLPEEIANIVDRIQQEFKPPRWNITLPPHITLIPPGKSIDTPDKATEVLESNLTNYDPFTIKLHGINSFYHNRHVIFLNVEQNNILFKLRQVLMESSHAFMQNNHLGKFYPHVTLANRLREREAPIVKRRLKEMNLDFEFKCDKIDLMSKDFDNQKWQLVSSFKF